MCALRQPSPSEQPLVTALPQTSHDVLAAIRSAYTFVDAADEAAVFAILATRPDVAAVLLEALPHVVAIFGDGTQVLLDVIDEHNSEPLRVGARIVSKASPDARNKLLAFFSAWWNDASGPVLGDLSFGLAYA
ncbi:MAG: hypothetical protein M3Z20_00805 [Chloroflexota bacterium]|nr:hypothetical protein [Chloroflexota bacterium]